MYVKAFITEQSIDSSNAVQLAVASYIPSSSSTKKKRRRRTTTVVEKKRPNVESSRH